MDFIRLINECLQADIWSLWVRAARILIHILTFLKNHEFVKSCWLDKNPRFQGTSPGQKRLTRTLLNTYPQCFNAKALTN